MPDRDLDHRNVLDLACERTPARLLVGRAGESYRTATQLELRADHAAARDAVSAELDADFLKQQELIEVQTRANSKAEFLLRPDLGRRLSDSARALLKSSLKSTDLQIAIGDGLSATAVKAQVPTLLPLLLAGAKALGWSVGTPFAIRYGRVGILNEIGELLDPKVAVLLIGERPGLATAESLSAYMAFCPRPGHTDAQRNLISNIHDRGVRPAVAAKRILALAETMLRVQASGVNVKEALDADFLPAREIATPLTAGQK
jgi:ethanolamine ammonia-lyase small subunit